MPTTVLITNGILGVTCFKTKESLIKTKATLRELLKGNKNLEPRVFADVVQSAIGNECETLGLSTNGVDLVFDLSGVCFELTGPKS